MTKLDLIDLFDSLSIQDPPVPEFADLTTKRSTRRDIHVFLLLDELLANPPETIGQDQPQIIAGAEHDEITLNAPLDALSDKITEAQVAELVGCGVFYDNDALVMFV